MKIVNNQLAWSRCVVTWLRMAQCTLVGKNSFEGGTVSKKKKKKSAAKTKIKCVVTKYSTIRGIFLQCVLGYSRAPF